MGANEIGRVTKLNRQYFWIPSRDQIVCCVKMSYKDSRNIPPPHPVNNDASLKVFLYLHFISIFFIKFQCVLFDIPF